MSRTRELKTFEAIQEALDLCLAADPNVIVMGLGVPDPKGVFGTTVGLQKKYGAGRVFDTPTSENAMTGIAIGAALMGLRPVLSHQRVDFALLSIDQIVSQAAKWRYMFGGRQGVPLVIRLIVGRGWGQGPQHSQSLQSWFAHVPGLKVVMPATPHDAKGLLISAIEGGDPVVFIEHRWLHNSFGPVPEGLYRVPIGPARVARGGKDLTIVAMSSMVPEALKAAEVLAGQGVETEVIDLRTLRPFDAETVLASVRKTGRLIVADTSWKLAGFGAEVVATVAEGAHAALKAAPVRFGLADCPAPTSPPLAARFYPRASDLVGAARRMLDFRELTLPEPDADVPHDVPDRTFTGPF